MLAAVLKSRAAQCVAPRSDETCGLCLELIKHALRLRIAFRDALLRLCNF